MSTTVSHLLKLTRKPVEKLETIALPIVVQDSLELFNTQLKCENIEVVVDIPDTHSYVEGESSGVVSVFQNLINNSRDEFARIPIEYAGNRTIVISVDEAKCTDDSVCIKFSDNAGGISPEIINSIFDPFFTTKDIGKGTGLGLSLSRRRVEEFGGKMSVRSFNKETHFSIFLKRGNPKTATNKVTSISDTPAKLTFPRIPGNKKTMLIVDDEIDLLMVLDHKLKHIYEITKTTSAIEGRDLLCKKEFDLLVTDLKMPVISGIDLIELAKRVQPTIGTVLISGHAAAAEDCMNQIKRCSVTLISKPLPDIEKLVELIEGSKEQGNFAIAHSLEVNSK